MRDDLIRLGTITPSLRAPLRHIIAHLDREAAAIKAPPRMLEEALAWFPRAYVTTMLRFLDKEIVALTPPVLDDRGGVSEEVMRSSAKEDFGILDMLMGFGAIRDFDQTVRFPGGSYARVSLPTGETEARVEVDGRHDQAGTFGELMQMLDGVYRRHDHKVLKTVDVGELNRKRYDRLYEEYQRRAREVGGEANAERALVYFTALREGLSRLPQLPRGAEPYRTLPLNLEGWYYDQVSLEERDRLHPSPIKGLRMGVDIAASPEMNAHMDVRGPRLGFEVPDPRFSRKPVSFYTRELISQISEAVHHEMRHFAQILISRWTQDGKFDGDLDQREHHDLMEVEFDAILGDEIRDYRRYHKLVPVNLRHVLFRVWVDDLKGARRQDADAVRELDAWVRANPMYSIRGGRGMDMLREGRHFFQILKREDPARWKAAIRQLAAQVPTR